MTFGADRDGAVVAAATSTRRVDSDIRACPAADCTVERRAASAYDLPGLSAGLAASFGERFVDGARLAGMPRYCGCIGDNARGVSDVGEVAGARGTIESGMAVASLRCGNAPVSAGGSATALSGSDCATAATDSLSGGSGAWNAASGAAASVGAVCALADGSCVDCSTGVVSASIASRAASVSGRSGSPMKDGAAIVNSDTSAIDTGSARFATCRSVCCGANRGFDFPGVGRSPAITAVMAVGAESGRPASREDSDRLPTDIRSGPSAIVGGAETITGLTRPGTLIGGARRVIGVIGVIGVAMPAGIVWWASVQPSASDAARSRALIRSSV